MTIRVSRIEVRNFRNFGHLVLDPFPQHAVITGENGVGKSNLLYALRLVLDPSLPDSARQLRAEDFWSGTQGPAESASISIQLDLAGFDEDPDAKAVLEQCVISYAPYVARLTYVYTPRIRLGGGIDDDEASTSIRDYDFSVFGGGDPSVSIRQVRRLLGLRILGALRDTESDLQNWRRNPLRLLLEGLPIDETALQDSAAAMSSAIDSLTRDSNLRTLQDNLVARVDSMTGPRPMMQPAFGFASSQPSELLRAVRLFIDEERRRSISDASLGASNILYLALLLEVLDLQRSSDQVLGTILAVEEPEAHLHVSLQRRLFRSLLRDDSAVLLTTHSPHVAAVAPVNSFVVLTATSDTGTQGRTTARLSLSALEKDDLERYLNVSRAEVLFSSFVILVEGAAELYLVPAFAAAVGFDLDSYGVVVSSVDGVDFAPYAKLLGPEGLDKPFIILTDGDSAADKRGATEAGLRRAQRLSGGEETLAQGIAGLPVVGSSTWRDARRAYTERFDALGLIVGEQTLEVDLLPRFGDEIRAAFADLVDSTPARDDIDNGISNESEQSPDSARRKQLLKRINNVGKGRFAQRLASYIQYADLREQDSGLHILRALNAASVAVRKVPLNFTPGF